MDAPRIGQIVEHHFLWRAEAAAGQVEGRKPRPCLVVAVEAQAGGAHHVTVLPFTSQAPREQGRALAVPDDLKSRIGLDRARPAWVVVDEANVFTWPGFDLVPQASGGFVRAVMTRGFFERVREAVLKVHARAVERDDGR